MIAAIDCGTNTIKLLIGDPPDVAVRETRMVRLGQGVDRTGRLSEEALARAFAAVDEYAALVREHDVSRIRFCATSATRDAANGDVFAAGVRERLGVSPEVLTGDEEAALAFDGAVRHLRTPPATPVLVVDIGGGSTELVLGGATPDAAHSMDVGSVRLHERHLHDDPPTPAQVRACVDDIDATLDAEPGRPGVGGHRRRRGRDDPLGGGRGAGPAGVRPRRARPVRRCRSRRSTTSSTGWSRCRSRSASPCRGCTRAAPT